MFDSLSERLGGILDRLTRRGALSEADVDAALREVRRALLEADVALDVVRAFVEQHEMTFVVEQNRDAQLRSLLMLETGAGIEKFESVRYYAGFPMSAHHVVSGVKARLERAA